MYDQLSDFFEQPTAAGYRRLRRLLMRDSSYAAGAEQWQLLWGSRRAQIDSIVALYDEIMPGWSLSPRVHYLAALAAEEQGNGEERELEQFMMESCLRGLLATGDGSVEHPYLATYPTDAGDVLLLQNREKQSQQIIPTEDGRWLDCLTTTGGTTLWFTATDLVKQGIAPLPAEAAGRL